jgi:hypothetical protein
LRSYYQIKFHFFGHLSEDGYTINEFKILDEKNTKGAPCDPKELLLEVTGETSDTYECLKIPKD